MSTADLAPRQRLLRHGAQGLSDAELLAVVLRNGSPGIPALAVAERLLDASGGLAGLVGANRQVLRHLGATDSRAAVLLATNELLSRLTRVRLGNQRLLNEPETVAAHIQVSYPVNGQELMGALYLDVRFRLIAEDEIYRGTLTRAAVEPRAILRGALLHSAGGLIVWHTHPSGKPEPSPEDWNFTQRLHQASELMGIRLVDHMILGAGGQWVSLSRREALLRGDPGGPRPR